MGVWGGASSGGPGGKAPGGVRGRSPPEADDVYLFKTVIFNASGTVFARHDVLFELFLSCSGLRIQS